jgi:hypothetical protein
MSKNIIWHPLSANPDSVNVEAHSHWNPEPVFLNF